MNTPLPARILAHDREGPRGCRGKFRFTLMSAARRTVRSMRKSPQTYDPDSLTAYKCDRCGGFHVGHRYRRDDKEE